MTTIPSNNRRFYGDEESGEYEPTSLNPSKGYHYGGAEKVMIELDELEGDLPGTAKNSKGTIPSIYTNTSTKNVKVNNGIRISFAWFIYCTVFANKINKTSLWILLCIFRREKLMLFLVSIERSEVEYHNLLIINFCNRQWVESLC